MARANAKLLRLGGLTPMSTADYPGALAATLFCLGCPWRCAYCHNAHLLTPEAASSALDWSEARDFLAQRRGLLDAVVFSGGEPTIQAALPAAMAEARTLGYRIGLHTGGPYPQRLARVLPVVDWIGLDIKALPDDYARVTGVPGSGIRAWKSLELALQAQRTSQLTLEVRTTPLPGLDTPAYLTRLMQALFAAGVPNYVLQHCRAPSRSDHHAGAWSPRLLERPDEIPPFSHFALR